MTSVPTASIVRGLPAAGVLLLLAACQSPVAKPAAASTATPADVSLTTNAFRIIQSDQQEGKLAQTRRATRA